MKSVILRDISPCASLQEYVSKYQVFRFEFNMEVIPPVKFHAPRPEHCITFYIRDAQKFSYIHSPTILTYPQCVINGMYTVPIHRYGGNDFLAIKVVLQPSTLFKITALSMTELTNKFLNAEEIWGYEIRSICEQLNALTDVDEMLIVIETYLKYLVKKITKTIQPIDKAIYCLLNIHNKMSLDWLADQSCLSKRQFIRKFEEQIGISAKTFERIIRFDRAFRMKNSFPNRDWLFIALACGYYDYQHLVKDYKEFTYLTPPAFYEVDKKSPERSFGLYEV